MRIKMKKTIIAFAVLLFSLVGCIPTSVILESTTPTSTTTTPTQMQSVSPPYDPYRFTFSTEIDPGFSEQKIAEILFSSWLDHFLSSEIPPSQRIDGYTIQSVSIPDDQSCAVLLNGLFIAEAEVLATTTLPLASTNDEPKSEFFVAGGGNIVDAHHLLRIFDAVISKNGDLYTLNVVTQVPICDKS